MDKPAKTEHPIHDLLVKRWSPRAFSDKPVEPAKLRQLFEAARWAASSFNEQPWSFIVALKEDRAAFDKALSCLFEQNQAWAKLAPVLVLTTVKAAFAHNGKPNRVAPHDLGLAMGNLTLQATQLGLWVHQMAGVHLDKVRETYVVPAGHDPMTAFTVGYMGDVNDLPEAMRGPEQSPRTRKPFGEFVFGDRFGEASELFT